ncbi:hypothetical protein A8C56_21210 [Niabella ginsenosidivorans]|uniref:Uncharacterized protein n=1 Tax=Niabella ginsenosidivorans TaxID=1176587 RepID=A0A1A9I9G4_9BACT|nr:hypothetical protein [Niabella ginsenosidivorans]ANH83164.1 hypothetical protein A8C56_21210 [Niabella ginsenosidivorans]
METNTPSRKRFYKSWHFLSLAGKRPLRILWEVFYHYHLDEMKEELQCWQQCALCNDNSAYSEENAREDLMDFIQHLLRLIEACHILNERKNADRKYKQQKRLPKEARQMIAKMNIPVLLTADEKKDPGQVITQFCKTFRRSYAQIELLDMLDSVITYKGDKEVNKGNLMMFYEALSVLVKLAYRMCRHENGVKSALVRGLTFFR